MGSCSHITGSCEYITGSCEYITGSCEYITGSCEHIMGSCDLCTQVKLKPLFNLIKVSNKIKFTPPFPRSCKLKRSLWSAPVNFALTIYWGYLLLKILTVPCVSKKICQRYILKIQIRKN
jgi:hypothetical protein